MEPTVNRTSLIRRFESLSKKFKKFSLNIWFNKTCLKEDLIPDYISLTSKINSTSSALAIRSATRVWIQSELNKWYALRDHLNLEIYQLHLQIANSLDAIEWDTITRRIKDYVQVFGQNLFNKLHQKITKLRCYNPQVTMDQVPKLGRPLDFYQSANIFSKITFTYTLPTLISGFLKKTLHEEDIPELSDGNRAFKNGKELEKYWKIQESSKKPSLWIALFRAFGLNFSTLGVVLLVDQVVFRSIRNVALIWLVNYFSQDDQGDITLNDAYMYGAIIMVLSLLNIFVSQLSKLYIRIIAMRIRVACSSLIYQKSLKLSKSVLEEVGVGHVTNLLSNDLGRLDFALLFAHFIWIAPVDVLSATIILYSMVGLSSAVGVAVMIIWCPLLVYVGMQCSKLRSTTATKTDKRIQLMKEILDGIKVIKMYTWEKPFSKLVDIVRRSEMHQIRNMNYTRAILRVGTIIPKIAIFVTIITHVLTGNTITAVYVFAVASFYENIKMSLFVNAVYGVTSMSELLVCIQRIQKFLLLPEMSKTYREKTQSPSIMLEGVTAKWQKNVIRPTLNNISLSISNQQLVGILGPVGSGKSSLFQVILNELPVERGTVRVHGKLSYASQEPWVFGGNIQQNILFGQQMDSVRYREVLRVCALEKDISTFPYGDQTLVGERGVILSGGQKARVSLARAIYMKADIYLLDDPFSAVDAHIGNHLFQECVQSFLKHKCVVLITHHLQFFNNYQHIYFLEDGSLTSSGSYEELKLVKSKFLTQLMHLVPDTSKTSHQEDVMNYSICEESKSPITLKEQRLSGSISNKVYMDFVKAGGSLMLFYSIILVFVLLQVCLSASDFFIAHWVDKQQEEDIEISNSSYVWIYTGIVVSIIFAIACRALIYFNFFTKTSIRLHNKMFITVINTPIKFFHANYSGRILNRFAKDVGIVDETIPIAIMDCLHSFLNIAGYIILICITNPWLILVTGILIVIFYFLRVFYMTTAQNLKRLEGTARSPLHGHVNETLQGMITVRAFNAELILRKEFNSHLDFHSSIWFLHMACCRTFAFYVDIVCIIYTAIIIFSPLINETEQYAGTVGLAVTQAFALIVGLQWGLIQSSEMENYMASVERVIEYTKLQSEENQQKPEAPSHWPTEGVIQFKGLSLKYSDDQPYILKNLNLFIESKQKIGIVGRTGAGKSSLITALFQLWKTEGAIYIDGIDITQISAQSLRYNISIIPQDPVLFSGTIRRNLDPLDFYSDSDLWSALDEVQLKSTVSNLPNGLDYEVASGGVNFSLGEKQLICLARAIIKKNAILVLDEATANVDLHSDTLIQNTIRNKFVECTVLTIAHRLNTIMDSDKVLVMDGGEIVEYNHPHLLLQNKSGMFYAMVQETGISMASSLSSIAENSYTSSATQSLSGSV